MLSISFLLTLLLETPIILALVDKLTHFLFMSLKCFGTLLLIIFESICFTRSISASSDNLEISTVKIISAGEFFPSSFSLCARPFLA